MWRSTGLPVRVLMLDARVCLPIVGACVYWSWATLYAALAGTAFFVAIWLLGLTLPALFRLLRRLAVGPVRPAVAASDRRRMS